MSKMLWVIMALASVIMMGCQIGSPPEHPSEDPFIVRVFTNQSIPLEGAVIEGGVDWHSFRVTTDLTGAATLPGYARGIEAIVHHDNHFPLAVTLKRPYEYELTPTPRKLRLLGDIKGWAVRITPGRVATVDYSGAYRLYAFDESGVSEITSVEVPRTIKQTKLIGNTLWLSTHEDGVFAYSLADPEHPLRILHLDLPGYTPIFALRDNMIVVGNYSQESSLGVYLFEADGSFVETARFGDSYVASIDFLDEYLVVTGYHDAVPNIYALHDPTRPVLVYKGAFPGYWSGILYGRRYIQIPRWNQITTNIIHRRLDLTNPALPRYQGMVWADSRLIAVIDEVTAIGIYHNMGLFCSVLKGNLAVGFRTEAIITRYGINEFGGCAPPYFVIGHRLWILEN